MMRVYRAFPWGLKAGKIGKSGDPLFIPSRLQGSGRHDMPDLDGVLYVSLQEVSALAERIQFFRNKSLTEKEFCLAEDEVLALAEMEVSAARVLDLTNAKYLVAHGFAPAEVATGDREKTQALARRIYKKGFDGFLWWSALEAKWTNATYFESRVKGKIALKSVKPLKLSMPEVKAAAKTIGVLLE